MPSDPHVSAVGPIPVAAQPDVARLRRYTDDLYLGSRGRHVDRAADVDHGFGHRDGAAYDAAAEQRSGSKRR
jgi:hypothetical protein